MLQLTSIRLYQFKNYKEQTFRFDKPIVGITGENGIGKTNLLDAVYYLGFTRSYFTKKEKNNLSYGVNAFRIDGLFLKNGKKQKVSCLYKNGKKEVLLNQKLYDRFSHHIGKFPVVFVAPDDNILITGGSQVRRKFLDMMLAQIDGNYLDELIAYQKIRAQRDQLLKDAGERRPDFTLLDTFDQQLLTHAQPLFDKRQQFLAVFEEKIRYYYHYLSGGKEKISLQYDSDLKKQPFEELLRNNRAKDCILQRTTKGPHRDDLKFLMNGNPIKEIGSQGQKKSFVFGLKLAQFEVIREDKEFLPVLLLDDIFEKLDHHRIKRLISLICGEEFGQVFITDTEADRLKNIFEESDVHLQLIQL